MPSVGAVSTLSEQVKSQYLQAAVEIQAEKKQLQNTCVELGAQNERLTAQVTSLKVQLEASREKNCALVKQCDELKHMLETSCNGAHSVCGLDWQFSSAPDEWTGFPVQTSEKLHGHYEAYLNGGEAVVQMKSGVEAYNFDFSQTCQTNVMTGKMRDIRCQIDTPSHWERCLNVNQPGSWRKARSISIRGFKDGRLDGVFHESSFRKINGSSVW